MSESLAEVGQFVFGSSSQESKVSTHPCWPAIMPKRTLTSVLVMSLFVVSAVSDVIPTVPQERYDEYLTIRPLTDGKVVTAFAFTTLLGGASPRDPRDSESSGGHTSLVCSHAVLTAIDPLPKPSITRSFHSLSAKSYANTR